MATSENFNTSNQYIKYRIVVTENSTSVANNTSNVTVTVQVWRTNQGYTTYGTGTCYCTIDGTQYSAAITLDQKFTYNSYTPVFSKNLDIAHNSNGSKSLSVSAYINHTNFTSSSQGFTVNLTNIPRYATVSQSLYTKSETQIIMKWSSDSVIDYVWYSVNNGSTWIGIDRPNAKSGSYTINNLSPNTNYHIKTRVKRADSQLTTDSSMLAVSTYDYPYANSLPTFTLGQPVTIGLYNPLNRRVHVNIIGNNGAECSSDYTTGKSITGYNGSGVVDALYATIPNASSGNYSVKVTFDSSVRTMSGGHYNINPADCTPSITSSSYRVTDSMSLNLTGDDQKVIQYRSTASVTATASCKKSATLSSATVTFSNGSSVANMSILGSVATGTVNYPTDDEYTITVTDSRGISYSETFTFDLLEWHAPYMSNWSVTRHNGYYSETDILVDDVEYSDLGGLNSYTLQYRYKRSDSETWSNYYNLTTGVATTVTLDNTYEWNVQIRLKDLTEAYQTVNYVLSKGLPIIYFDKARSSVGVNCFPKEDDSLEVNGYNVSRREITLFTTIENTVGTAGSIQPIDFGTYKMSHPYKFRYVNDGVEIGENMSLVKVSGTLNIKPQASGGQRQLVIYKNSTSNIIAKTVIATSPSSLFITMSLTPILVEVQQGDILYMGVQSVSASDAIEADYTYMTVEAVE